MAASARLRLPFRELAQPAEVARPHLPQYDFEWAERLAVRFVVAMGPLAPPRDQAGILDHAEILGHRGPADVVDGCRDFTGGALGTPDQPKDLATSWTGDRIHGGFQPTGTVASSDLHSRHILFKVLLDYVDSFGGC